jgi:hypothetical protein
LEFVFGIDIIAFELASIQHGKYYLYVNNHKFGEGVNFEVIYDRFNADRSVLKKTNSNNNNCNKSKGGNVPAFCLVSY